MSVAYLLQIAGDAMEVAGVCTIVVGTAIAFLGAAPSLLASDRSLTYRQLRERLGRAILLGLELLVGADIIQTIHHDATLRAIAALSGIVLLRTFLSFTLEVELDGRWPWQRSPR